MATKPQVLLVADRPDSAVIQPGQPPATMGAWLLDIPDGSNALDTAAAFVANIRATAVSLGTVVRVIDLSANPITVRIFRLDSSWTEIT